MKITKLGLENFRGFDQKEIEFNQNFNVIIGDNGMGKTSILEAIAIAISPYINFTQRKNVRPIKQEDIKYSAKFNKEQRVHTVVYSEWQTGNARRKTELVRERFNYGFVRNNARELTDLAKHHAAEIAQDRNVKLPVFEFLGCGRLWREPMDKLKTLPEGSRFTGYNHCLSSTSSLKVFAEWIKTQTLASLQGNSDSRKNLTIIETAVLQCLEGCTRFFFDVKDDELKVERKDATGNNELIPFKYLSDGQRNIIGIVGEICYRCIVLNPHLENPCSESEGIVLIDEIDLHLHPKWQRYIVGYLKNIFNKIQFITTTHSPFIVQSLKNEELIDLQGQEVKQNYYNLSIEDIVESEMGLSNKLRSTKFNEMLKAAEEYYALLEKGDNKSTEFLQSKSKLEELEERFSEDPAYVALLRAERKTKRK